MNQNSLEIFFIFFQFCFFNFIFVFNSAICNTIINYKSLTNQINLAGKISQYKY